MQIFDFEMFVKFAATQLFDIVIENSMSKFDKFSCWVFAFMDDELRG